MENLSLDELLGEESAAEIVEAPVVVAEPVETAEAAAQRERDERGRFAAKGDTDAPPASSEGLPAEEFKGLKDERRKRQEAEQRLADALAQIEAAKNPPAPAPDIWEDTQGWQAQFREQLLSDAEQRALARFEERNIARSAAVARGKYQDFDDVIGSFSELAKENPMLERQLRDADNPGEFAYTTAKAHMELQQHGGDLNALVAARVKAELEKAVAPQPKPEAPSIPESLAGAQSARGTSVPSAAPASLDDILRGK